MTTKQTLSFLVLVAVLFQVWILWHATDIHNQHALLTIVSTSTATTSTSRAPRLLIGILGNANNHMGLVYRDRHRQLFQLWNDSRLCMIGDVHPKCQIVYTFVLGGINGTTAPPYNLGDDNLTLNTHEIGQVLPRYKDILKPDVTVLNIRENMNDGKTPTFFHWAAQFAKQHQLDYIVKCDSDAMLRWNALLKFIHVELPWSTQGKVPRTVLGYLRHKAFWNVTDMDETLWQTEWYQGMHLYLAGQLYLMSVEVAELLVQEARQWYIPSKANTTLAAPYFAGHEDHDAISMIQISQQIIRWLSVSKHYTFWEHPIKGDYRWGRILAREQKQAQERLQGTRPPPPIYPQRKSTSQRKSCSLLVIVLSQYTTMSTIKKQRDEYLAKWKRQNYSAAGAICSIADYFKADTNNRCELYYVFVVGTDPKGRPEVLEDASTLLTKITGDNNNNNNDIWHFHMRHNVHQGMGTTLLYWIHNQLPNYTERLDTIVLIQSSWALNWTRWTHDIVPAQIIGNEHALVMGDVRDKYQEPREFPHSRGIQELYWYNEFDYIHLYLGSECIVLGASLIAGIVEQAQNNVEARTKYVEEHLGHDLTMWAYYVPKTLLNWIPITKSQRFWYALD